MLNIMLKKWLRNDFEYYHRFLTSIKLELELAGLDK